VVLRRSLALFVATAIMMVMMAVTPAFVQPGRSENSCGASNPVFGKLRLRSEHSAIAGSKTNRCFWTNPKSPILVRRARRKRVLESDVSNQAGRARVLGQPRPYFLP
jgi:hypothetical protein